MGTEGRKGNDVEEEVVMEWSFQIAASNEASKEGGSSQTSNESAAAFQKKLVQLSQFWGS